MIDANYSILCRVNTCFHRNTNFTSTSLQNDLTANISFQKNAGCRLCSYWARIKIYLMETTEQRQVLRI